MVRIFVQIVIKSLIVIETLMARQVVLSAGRSGVNWDLSEKAGASPASGAGGRYSDPGQRGGHGIIGPVIKNNSQLLMISEGEA